MNGELANGTMGSMMWGSPDRLRAACANWAVTDGGNTSWCNAMSDWMDTRARQSGGWGGWMMQP